MVTIRWLAAPSRGTIAAKAGRIAGPAWREDDLEMRAFKAELREDVIRPERVPGRELSKDVQYEDGRPAAFLRRLWRDLYGDEPPGAPGPPEPASGAPSPRGSGP